MDRSESELGEPLTRILPLGLGLIYLGKQESVVEATAEVSKTFNEKIRKYCDMTLISCAYAGTGNVLKVLDWMLGKGHAALLRRAELKTFVEFHGNEAGKGGDLTHDETTIIAGALELTEKTAKDAMTPISKAFSLDLDATLDLDTPNAIMTMGYSRVPVYSGNPNNIIGLFLVKNLLTVNPIGEVSLRQMIIRKIPRVSEDMPLYDILNEFQKGHSHIAVVYKDLSDKKDGEQFKDSCRKLRGQPDKSLKKS